MISLLEFYKEGWGETTTSPTIIGKEVVLKYLERRIQENCGFRTPKAVLYALEYFGVIFGFQEPGSRLPRCRKMAEDYASKAPPRTPAKHISVDFMKYLEEAVLCEERSVAERLVCGKLRLCAQASIRHDDLERTPISKTEWIRLKGGLEIVGLRACAPVTKSGVRPWVASYLAVCPENDVLLSHGESWSTREFFCPGFSNDTTPLGIPSSWSADVAIVKRMLAEDAAKGRKVPLDGDTVESFRWHGSKATMPTIMAHFGTKAKVIRYQGNWSKKADSMPDTYLREAQVIVLKGQIEVLERIRAGETLDTLVGVPLAGDGSGPRPDGEDGSEVPNPAGASANAEHRSQKAMASTLAAGCRHHEGFNKEKLPVAAEFPTELADVNFKFCKSKGIAMEEALQVEEEESVVPEEGTIESMVGQMEDLDSLPSCDSDASLEQKDMELVPCFIASGGRGRKLHKPPLDFELGAFENPIPRCRAAGKSFEVVGLAEALAQDVSLCLRCFGPPGKCNSVCSHIVKIDGEARRCGRRCCLGCTPGTGDADDRNHSCSFHVESNMEEEL